MFGGYLTTLFYGLLCLAIGFTWGAGYIANNSQTNADVVKHECAKPLYPTSKVLIWNDDNTRSDGK